MEIVKFSKMTNADFIPYNEEDPTTVQRIQDVLRNNNAVMEALVKRLWQPETPYSVGNMIESPNLSAFMLICLTAGVSGRLEPAWTEFEDGATVLDGSVVWSVRGYVVQVVSSERVIRPNTQTQEAFNEKMFSQIGTKKADNTQGNIVTKDEDNNLSANTVKLTTLNTQTINGALAYRANNSLDNELRFCNSIPEIRKWLGIPSIRDNLPAAWFERGNGNLGDVVCTDGQVITGVWYCKNFTIPSGVTVYIDKTAKICCVETFVNHGTINGDGRGGKPDKSGETTAYGYGYGGAAGGGDYVSSVSGRSHGSGGPVYLLNHLTTRQGGAPTEHIYLTLSTLFPVVFASSGGGFGPQTYHVPGSGGAGLIVLAKTISSNTITCRGTNGTDWYIRESAKDGRGISGGGGGGVAILIADAVMGGAINVSGGAGGPGGQPGSSGWTFVYNLV